jgi:outer membrane autotransporter protein
LAILLSSASTAALLLVTTAVHADQIIDGGSSVVISVDQPVTGNLFIGYNSVGTLLIENGAKLSDAFAYGGVNFGSSANVTVRGAESYWENTHELHFGYRGGGTLTIEDGGKVSNTVGVIANSSAAPSTVTVTGTNSQWINSSDLYIGISGAGTLEIRDGATVASFTGLLSYNPISNSKVLVDGSKSTWTNSGQLYVGLGGTGTLNVQNGGHVSDTDGIIGTEGTSNSFVTVTGAGSTWTNSNILFAGWLGKGTLTIDESGYVSASTVQMGAQSSGHGTLIVRGTDGNRGILQTERIARGDGGATLNLDGGILRAQKDEADFLSGFTSGSATIGMGGAFLDTNGHAIGVSSPLNGAGGLTKLGDGVLTLSGSQTYGGVTTVEAGTLSINGALSSPFTAVKAGANLTGSGAISGSVLVADSGTLSGTGGQTLSMQSLSLENDANLRVTLNTNDAVPLFAVTGDLALRGAIAVDEASDLSSATSFKLFTYGGALTSTPLILTAVPVGYRRADFSLDTSSGQVVLKLASPGDQSYWTQGPGTWCSNCANWSNADGSLLSVRDGDTAVFRGPGGLITIDGPQGFRALRFEANGYRIESGAAGELVIDGSRGDVRVESGDMAMIASPISGSAALIKGGAGTLILSGANTYRGGTRIVAGTLGISHDANLGDAGGKLTIEGAGTLQAKGDLSIARLVTLGPGGGAIDSNGHALTVSSVMDGAGTLTKLGTGTLTLSGLNTYTGGTTLGGGTLVGSATSFGNGAISNSGTLVVDQASLGTMANSVNGTGTLRKRGSGALNLTGANGLTGATSVEAGHLAVNGLLTNSVVTLTGGSLGGTGTVGGIVVRTNTIVAPGNSIGTLNVSGNVSFGSGSIYQVEINAAGASDHLAVTGTAILSGGTVDVQAEAGSYQPSTTYTILTAAGGLANTTFDPFLSYTANDVVLTLTRKTVPTDPTDPTDPGEPTPQPVAFNSVAESGNQYRVADAVEALGPGHRLYNAVIGQSVAGARQAFNMLSGEAHASGTAAAFRNASLVQTALGSRLRQPLFGNSIPLLAQSTYTAAYAADKPGAATQPVAVTLPAIAAAPRYALWGEGFGSWGSVGGNGNAAGLDSSTGGFILGADTRLDGHSTVGMAGGFARTTFDVDGRLSSGSTDSIFVALYGSTAWGNLNLRLGASYAWNDMDVSRSIRFPSFSDSTHASYDGYTALAFAELGYRVDLGAVQLEPFVGASVLRLHSDGFQEEGGAAALTGYAQDQDLATTTLGLRAEARLSESLPLTVRGLLGWRHTFGDVAPESLLAFAGSESPFAVQGTPLDRDVLVAEAGLDWQASDAISFGIAYSGQAGEHAQEHSLKGNFTWRFGTR